MRKMGLALLSGMLLMDYAGRQASAQAPDQKQWQELLGRISSRGETIRRDEEQLVYRTLTRIDPQDAPSPHQRDFISLVHGGSAFQPLYVAAVSGRWEKNAQGHWVVDHWIYRLSLEGRLVEVTRMAIIQDGADLILDFKILLSKTLPEDLETLERWRRKLAQWSDSKDSPQEDATDPPDKPLTHL